MFLIDETRLEHYEDEDGDGVWPCIERYGVCNENEAKMDERNVLM